MTPAALPLAPVGKQPIDALAEHVPTEAETAAALAALRDCLAPVRFRPGKLDTAALYRAAEQIAACEAGRRTLPHLAAFLDEALSLDGRNRQAALDLIAGCLFGAFAGTARDAIACHLPEGRAE